MHLMNTIYRCLVASVKAHLGYCPQNPNPRILISAQFLSLTFYMAKNRENENIVESSDSSDNESAKETGSHESDSESDSEPEITQTPAAAAAKKPLQKSASKPQQQPHTSSESGSGSESVSEGHNPKDSPIPTQAKYQQHKSTNGAKKSRSKPSSADPVTPTKSSADPVTPNKSAAKKRPADDKDTTSKPAKKSKKKAQPESSEKKSTDTPNKSIIQRIWSEEDETMILQGMIDYKAKKKADPAADMNDFHAFIQKNLSIKDFDKLQGKISRLKKKYKNNKIKEEKDGKEMTFSKPHERKVYELSKSVWGNKEEAAKDDKAVAAVDAETESVLANRVKSIGVIVEERVLTVGAEKFEKEWKKLTLEEMQANLRLLEVKTAQARLVVDRLKSEGI